MPQALIASSPVHPLLDALGANWKQLGQTPIAAHFGAPKDEAKAALSLGLCDVSALVKLGIKGPLAKSWLQECGVDVPVTVFETRPQPDRGLIAQVHLDEFVIESGIRDDCIKNIMVRLEAGPCGIYPIERHEATFFLSGSHTLEVLAQTCSVNFREVESKRLIYTRIAGTSCAVMPEVIQDIPVYRIWIDRSLAIYLWQILAEIVENLGGQVVGATCFYPELGLG